VSPPGQRDPGDLVQCYFALLSGDPAVEPDEILSAGFVFHHPPLTPPAGWVGRDTFLARALTVTRAAFPDMRFEIADLIVDGDRAAARWMMHATHHGAYLGVPPTGRSVAVTGMNIFHVEAGRIVATWVARDTYGLLTQLGHLPAPPSQPSP